MSYASRLDAYLEGDAGARNIFCERRELWWTAHNEAKQFDCPGCEERSRRAQEIRKIRQIARAGLAEKIILHGEKNER